jgi:hypothetical protein
MSRTTFEEVYTGRMEKYVDPSRRPLIKSLVADQIAAIRVITKILEVIESTDDIDCYMKKPDTSCSPRCIMEGGGIIYKTRDNIPHSVVTNSGIINFTRGFYYTNNSLKVLHEKLTMIFSLKKFHTTLSGIFGVTYTYDWYNITRTDFGNERLNLGLTIDNFTYTKTRQEIISDQERKAVEAGALIEVWGLVSPFVFQFNKRV